MKGINVFTTFLKGIESMLVRARSPLRLGIAGGGTDISPYSDTFGGCVLNATIDMYANCTIELLEAQDGITFVAQDIEQTFHSPLLNKLLWKASCCCIKRSITALLASLTTINRYL